MRYNRYLDDITPVWTEISNNITVIRWLDQRAIGHVYQVFIDGVLVAETEQLAVSVDAIPENAVIRVAKKKGTLGEGLNNFFTITGGNRIQVTCPEVDLGANPDFYSYLFWYGSSSADTFLKESIGANNNTALSPQLDSGTWFFRCDLKDIHGNILEGTESSYDFVKFPLPASGVQLTYNNPTATITWEGSDLHSVYSNYSHRYGLQNHVVDTKLTVTASGTYETFPLASGCWHFAVRRINAAGQESAYELLQLNLGDSLSVVPDRPDAPSFIDAVPGVSGAINLTAYADSANVSGVAFFQDGTEIIQVSGVSPFTFTTDPLTHDISYAFNAAAFNNAGPTVFSEWSYTQNATADALPPSGNTTLSFRSV